MMCQLIGRKHTTDEKVSPFMSPAKEKLYNLTQEALIAQAEDMGEDAIEAGRKSFSERFKQAGIEYNAATLGALKCGMEFMLVAMRRSEEEDKDITMLALAVAAKLERVEKDIAKAATTAEVKV